MTLGGAAVGVPVAEEGLIGPLCDLFVPRDPHRHQVALLAVMGSTLTHTVVVKTRTLAVAAANISREVGIAGVTFDILDEVVAVSERGGKGSGERRGEEKRGEYNNLPTGSSSSNSNNSSSNSNGSNHGKIISLLDCIHPLVPLGYPCVKKRLENWVFYDGSTTEALRYVQSLSRRDAHIVSADGSRFFADGVIQLHGAVQSYGVMQSHGSTSSSVGGTRGGDVGNASNRGGNDGVSGSINTATPLPLWPSSQRLHGMQGQGHGQGQGQGMNHSNGSRHGRDQGTDSLKLTLTQLR